MMKKSLCLLAAAAVMVSASVASAAGPSLYGQPVYLQDAPPLPAGPHASPDPVASAPVYSAPVELFHCVKYKDHDEMAPCAVPCIIKIKDPCACNDPCNCCGPKCVNVKICVPPCGCPPRVKSNRDGTRVRYDYGEYAVDVRVKKGYIEVDYQD